MKKLFGVFTAITLAAAAALSMAACGDQEMEKEESKGKSPYRILAVGASFTEDAMRYMRDMLIANGAKDEDICIVNAYGPGRTLEQHYTSARYELKNYTRKSFGKNGSIKDTENVTSKSIIAENDWDYIVFQQGGDRAGHPASYKDSDIAYLIDFVKKNCPNPNVKIGFHMTWAYAKNSSQSAFGEFYNGDQTVMYDAIISTVKAKIAPNSSFDFIIPSGTAIQNARTFYGDRLNSDGYHLNDIGRFIAGAMWLKEIYGFSTDVFDSYKALNGYNLSREDIVKIVKCVEDAFAKPFEITDNGQGAEEEGPPPAIDGTWHNAQWAEAFTFDVTAKTFVKMSDDGWGERGKILYTTNYTPNTVTCIITHKSNDGINWTAADPTAQLIWIRPYRLSSDGNTLYIWDHPYVKANPNLGTGGEAPYRILSIGASFTRDAMRYMRDMLIQNGIPDEDIAIVNAYIGGQTLRGHANNAKNGSPAYTRESFQTGGGIARTYEVSSLDILRSNSWDIVSFQQGAAEAGNPAAYDDSDIEYLVNFVKENCSNPSVKIYFYMTWAYAEGSNQQAYINFGNQSAMYNGIVNTVKDKILPKVKPEGSLFNGIIPAGTAFQNARVVFGDILCGSDTYHASDLGRFIAGAMWLRQLYGLGINSFNSYKTLTITLSRDDILKIEKCVLDAFNNPFQTTQ